MQELNLAIRGIREEEAGLDRARDRQADRAAEQRAKDACRRRIAQAGFEGDNESGENDCETDVGDESDGQRLKQRRRVRDSRNNQHTREHEPGHGVPRYERPTIPSNHERRASSASPALRTPTSSQLPPTAIRSSGSMFASGMTQRRNPICAASRIRSPACVTPRTSPASPISPNTAVLGGMTRFRTLDAIADTMARSAAGSSIAI